MGGSFESGAGDDPNDLFTSEKETNEETEAGQSEHPQQVRNDTVTDTESSSDQSPRTNNESPTTSEATVSGTGFTVDAESKPEIDAAQLAREFVPDMYDKPHAWALGRDGVGDGRAEKKTFFLQSSVLDLEAACSQEVNEILDGDVPLTDLRELALVLAYHQPELLAEAAREWGAESA